MGIEYVSKALVGIPNTKLTRNYTQEELIEIRNYNNMLLALKSCIGERVLYVLADYIENYPEEALSALRELSKDYQEHGERDENKGTFRKIKSLRGKHEK